MKWKYFINNNQLFRYTHIKNEYYQNTEKYSKWNYKWVRCVTDGLYSLISNQDKFISELEAFEFINNIIIK